LRSPEPPRIEAISDVLDYLAEEVLERQPESVRGFLLETSVLDYLSGSLCEAVTGSSDGQERLERDNLFVVALDEERHWYRYHHLFAEFLRTRLQRDPPTTRELPARLRTALSGGVVRAERSDL
jgi:ATP/maltotriose-dependent transcriptional regulator MalT